MSSQIQIPSDYTDFVQAANKLGIADLVFHSSPKSVVEYADSDRIPVGFPRHEDHFVIADYLIDLPVVAIDCSTQSPSYGRILAYTYGDYWAIAESLPDLLQKLHRLQETALYDAKPVA